MHLVDRAAGFYGSVPIVAGTVPIAAGAALAAKLSGNGEMAVSYFGDGATEEGGVQETLNAAAIMGLPIVFVCENNLFSSHMHISLRQPDVSTVRFAKAHHIPYELIDGNDIVMVTRAMARAAAHTRQGKGPYYLEAFTYRWRGHVGHQEDLLIGRGAMDNESWERMQADVGRTVLSAWEEAESSPFPPASALLDFVYSNKCREGQSR